MQQNEQDTTPMEREAQAIESSVARPWRRFLARAIDLFLLAYPFNLLWIRLPFPHFGISATIAGLLCLFTWVFVEAIFLSTWGTTPGKWILKTHIRARDGQKLTFRHALHRSFLVWFKGLGMGIPLVVLITLFVSYHELKKNGVTTWDKVERLIVTHEEISASRIIIGLSIIILSDLFSFISAFNP